MTSPVIGTPWKKLNAPVSEEAIEGVDKYWRAANYLSIGQIYLRSNPLMKEPFTREDVKHRLVGHWGTTPGLNFLIGHINRLIADHQQNTVIIMGPGHGGPAGTAQSYLDGTYTEYFPNITKDEAGLQKFFRQFSYPGGIPSHYAPETPGSICSPFLSGFNGIFAFDRPTYRCRYLREMSQNRLQLLGLC